MTSADFLRSLDLRISLGQYVVFAFMPPSSTAGRLSVWGFAFTRTLTRGSLPLYSFVFLRPKVCFRFFCALLTVHALTFNFGWPDSPGGNLSSR